MSIMFSNMSSNVHIYVKDIMTQNWILTAANGHNKLWTTENVIVKNN